MSLMAKPHVDTEKRTVEMSYSSEFPVERADWGGEYYEVLGHKKKEINAERMDNAAFLQVHDQTKPQLGKIINHVSPGDDARCRATVLFSRSQAGVDAFNDYADGIKGSVSVGYDIHAVEEMKKEDLPEELQKHIKRNIPILRVTNWTPLELSDAPVPADHTVGAGRAKPQRDAAEMGEEIDAATIEESPEKFVEEFEFEADGKKVKIDGEGKPIKKKKGGHAMEITVAEREKISEDARKELKLNLAKRQKLINDYAEMPQFKGNAEVAKIVREFSAGGEKSEGTVEEFAHEMLTRVHKAKAIETDNTNLGMSIADRKKYSILKGIRGMLAAQTGTGRFEGLEAEASREVAKRLGKEPTGFFVPDEALAMPFRMRQPMRRDLSTLTGPAGGFGVETEVMAQDFIWLLRNRMISAVLGVTMLNGLEGNLAIPKQTAAASAYWVPENGAGTESDQTLGQVAMTPRQLIAYTNFSKQLIAQSSLDVEGFVRDDLAMITAIALDSALINGTGADGQPLGLLNQPGLSVVSLGTNGAAPTKAANVQLKTNVAAANADFGNLAYLTNAQSRGKQEATVEVSGFPTWLWNDVPTGGVGELPMGRVQGTPAYVSQQVPSNLVKGGSGAVCSAQIYGNWQSAMIGRWSNALDIVVNPYSLDTTREIRISVSLMADVNFRWLPGFSAILDMLTT